MSLSVEQMRTKIAGAYDSWRWRNRVAGMAPNQVIAIYRTLRDRGKFKKAKKSKDVCTQLTIFDFGVKMPR